ncbi:MAG: hypothetical protein JXR49_17585 [Acidobacteria bacterium]|nr:hypothetical protein [Acidobacteriota bacterium]
MASNSTGNLVSVGQIMEDFGCSERQVGRFVSMGMPKTGRGSYDRLQCLRWYARKLKKDREEIEKKKAPGGLYHEKVRVARAKADLREMEASRMRSSLVPVDICQRNIDIQFAVVRKAFLPVAAQIASQLVGLNRMKIRELLHKRLCEILLRLSTGEDFEKALYGRVRSRQPGARGVKKT